MRCRDVSGIQYRKIRSAVKRRGADEGLCIWRQIKSETRPDVEVYAYMSDREFDIKKAYERWLREEQNGGREKKTGRKESGSPEKKTGENVRNRGKKSGHKESGSPEKKTGENVRNSRGRQNRQEEPDSRRKFGRQESPANRWDKEDQTRPERPEKKSDAGFSETKVCPYAKRCGGCSYINRDYEWSLGYKEMKVKKLLKPYVSLSGIIGMEDPFHYRNKVHAVFAHVRDGHRERNVAGIYEQGTHKVVPVKKCMIENEKADEIIQDILGMLSGFKIKVYDEDTGYGLLRHVLVRTAHVTGQIMVVLVLSSPILPGKNNFVKALREKHPEITTIILNVNDEQTSMVLGEREIVLYGKGYIEDTLCGHTFRISAKSFYQVNSVQTEKLYRKAVEYANLTGHERVIDAYCGIGTIGITAAPKAGEVIGVELNGDAVRDAVRNARENRIGNISFYNNDAGDFLSGMARDGEKAEVVFMDPPRSGSTEKFMSAAVSMSPGRIIYISCEPETLARDLQWLRLHGYKAREATAFDMFPFTDNVEVVVLLSRNGTGRQSGRKPANSRSGGK